MKKCLMKYFLIISLLFLYGCTPPPISILNLTDEHFSEYYIEIDNDAYFLAAVYSMDNLQQRFNDSLNSYFYIELDDGTDLTFDSLTVSSENLIGISEDSVLEISIYEIKEIEIMRESSSWEKELGWQQLFSSSLLGFIVDLSSKKSVNKNKFTGTKIGASLGLLILGITYLDYYRSYETIHVKK